MERRFDMTDFEQSLREHADHFIMIPSKKVWHGIYNDLHPGSKWPSFTVALVFLFALIGIGHFNNTNPEQLSGSNDPASEKNSNNFNLITQSYHDNLTSAIKSYSGGNLTFWKNEALINRLQAEDKVVKSHFVEKPVFYNDKKNAVDVNLSSLTSASQAFKTAKVISLREKAESFDRTKRGQAINAIQSVVNVQSTVEKLSDADDLLTHATPDLNISKIDVSGIYPQNVIFAAVKYTAIIEDNYVTDGKNLPAELLQKQVQPVKVHLDKAQTTSLVATNESAAHNSVSAKARKKSKVGWLYFVSPTVGTVSFNGKAFAPGAGRSLTPLSVANQRNSNMIYNARLGYAAGIQMSYSFSHKWHLITGATINYSGYKVISNQVHPTFAYLMLRDNQTGGSYSKSYITHYGNGQGQNQISLSNKNLQLSVPIGLEYNLWGNENIKITIASSIAPSAVLKSNSFIMSADGRNYVSDPSLLRKFNLGGNFGSFVTFSSKKIKWHIGPNVRYQILSTYKQEYPVKEHLIDYGIKVGISK